MNTLLLTNVLLVPIALTIAIAVITLIIGGFIGYALFRFIIKQKYNKYINDAEKEAETIKKNKLLEVKEKSLHTHLHGNRSGVFFPHLSSALERLHPDRLVHRSDFQNT